MKIFLATLTTIVVTVGVLFFCAFEKTQKILLPISEYFYSKGVFRIPAESNDHFVILTIDDAPSSRTTEILDLLAAFNAHATFFVHTDQISDDILDQTIAKILINGNELGHHMPRDTPSIKLTQANFKSEFEKSEAVLANIRPGSSLPYFRAAGGYYSSARMDESLERFGYNKPLASIGSNRRYIMASYIPWDAGGATNTDNHAKNTKNAIRYGNTMASNLFPGAIVVFHDGEQGNRQERLAATLISLEIFLQKSSMQGYDIVTLSEGINRSSHSKG